MAQMVQLLQNLPGLPPEALALLTTASKAQLPSFECEADPYQQPLAASQQWVLQQQHLLAASQQQPELQQQQLAASQQQQQALQQQQQELLQLQHAQREQQLAAATEAAKGASDQLAEAMDEEDQALSAILQAAPDAASGNSATSPPSFSPPSPPSVEQGQSYGPALRPPLQQVVPYQGRSINEEEAEDAREDAINLAVQRAQAAAALLQIQPPCPPEGTHQPPLGESSPVITIA